MVWDIVSGNGSSALPALRFRYALVSPNFTYHGPKLTWFLNDMVAMRCCLPALQLPSRLPEASRSTRGHVMLHGRHFCRLSALARVPVICK